MHQLYTPEEENLHELVQYLRRFPLFERQPHASLFRVAKFAKIETCQQGHEFFQEEQTGVNVYFIIRGECHVRMRVQVATMQLDEFQKEEGERLQAELQSSMRPIVGPTAHLIDSHVPHFWESYTEGGNCYSLGRFVEVTSLGKSDMFGEDVCFTATRQMTVMAHTEVEVLILHRSAILHNIGMPLWTPYGTPMDLYGP